MTVFVLWLTMGSSLFCPIGFSQFVYSSQATGWENGMAAGIDPAPDMIALEIDFRVGVIESLPFPEATFDAVTSSLMMHHLPEKLRVQGLAEIWRTLKPGGRILIADMKRPNGSAFSRFFTSVILHHGHVLEFGLQDVPALLRGAGFEDVEQLEAHFLMIGFVRAKKPEA